MAKTLKILVVDDHKLLMQGFAEVLNQFSFVDKVDTCTNYEELKQHFKRKVPGVLFLDLNLPPDSGIAICREIKQQYKNLCVAVLTSYNDEFLIREAEKSGASAYFLKSTDINIIEKFLSQVYKGVVRGFTNYAPKDSLKTAQVFETDSFAIKETLTAREREVMKLIACGMNHEEIMAELDICYDTFKSHRSHVLQKLKLKNVVELARFASRNNMLN